MPRPVTRSNDHSSIPSGACLLMPLRFGLNLQSSIVEFIPGRVMDRHLRPASRRAAEDAAGTPLGDGARDGALWRGRSPVLASRPKPAGAGARPRAHVLAGAVLVGLRPCGQVGTHVPYENGCTGDLSAEDIPDLPLCGVGICEAVLTGLICPMAQHPNWRRTTRSGRAPPAALRPAAGAQPAPDLSANGRAAPSLVRPRAQARMPALACPVGQPLRMS
jgi:hypothetical protein